MAAQLSTLIEMPRGSLYREKSGTVDIEDKADSKILSWRDAAYTQGISELKMNPEYEEIQKYINLLEGNFYADQAVPSWRSRFVDNRMATARIETLAYLTDIRPTIDITTKVDEYQKAANIIKGVIQLEWKNRRMDQALEEVIDHALFSVGFWKVSCSYPGEFNVIPCGLDTVIPIQQGRDLQESVAILYRSFKSPSFFKSRWPGRAIGIEKEADSIGAIGNTNNNQYYSRPFGLNEYSWGLMSPAMRYHKAIHQSPRTTLDEQWSTFPLIEYQEYWIEDWHINETGQEVIVKDPYKSLEEHNYWYRVRPNERLYPRKRLLVFGGDRLMYDGPSPYWHGMFPFAKLRLNPVVWASGGISYYRDLRPLNSSINKIGTGLESVVDKAVKPIAITKDGAVAPTAWEKFFTDRPGAKLKLTPMGIPNQDVRFMDPPVLPGYVLQYVQHLIQTFRERAGSADLSNLSKKKQLPGGDTVEQFKDSMTSARRRELRNIEMFLEDAGKLAVPCVSQFFSRDQRLRMLGADGVTPQDFDYSPGSMESWAGLPEEFAKNFGIEITPGSLHPGSKDREKLMSIQLFTLGAISMEELHRRLEIHNSAQIVQEIQRERASGLGPPQKKPRMTRGQRQGQPV